MWEDILKRNTKIDEIFIKKYEEIEFKATDSIASALNSTKVTESFSLFYPCFDTLIRLIARCKATVARRS